MKQDATYDARSKDPQAVTYEVILPTWWPQLVWEGWGWRCHTRRKLHKLLDQQMSEFYIFHYFGLCSTIRFLCISSICFIFSSFKLGLPEAGGGIQQWWESSDSTRCSRGNPKPLKHSRKQYQNPRIFGWLKDFFGLIQRRLLPPEQDRHSRMRRARWRTWASWSPQLSQSDPTPAKPV